MNFKTIHPADQIVMIMNRLYYHGQTTVSGGNLSVRDSDGVIWISPSGINKGNLNRDDIMQILPDGTHVGKHKASTEYPFHCQIYAKRPDLNAVFHAHPPALVALSVARQNPNERLLPDVFDSCGNITMAKYALPGSLKLGELISNEFEKGINTVMMENHGVVVGAKDLFSAYVMFENVVNSAECEIAAHSLNGTIRELTDEQLKEHKERDIMSKQRKTFVKDIYSSEELAARRDICTTLKTAYGNRLITSAFGTFAYKLSDGSFIITPNSKDRYYLESEDLVHVKNGKYEKGKSPSRVVDFVEKVFKMHDDVKTIFFSRPPYTMGFGITGKEFDGGRLIPESYIALKEIQRYPFGATYKNDDLAKKISIEYPVAIIDNDCACVVGTSILNALDRMEVLEYSARELTQVEEIKSKQSKISKEEIEEIKKAFKL